MTFAAALFLSAVLDLMAPTGQAVSGGLQLAMTLTGGAVRDGQVVTVRAELKNVSKKVMRVVWKPSGPQPLTLLIDGHEHAMPLGISTAALLGWVELKPGESIADQEPVVLAPGPHQLFWRYVVTRGPYGRQLEHCWTGTMKSTPLKVQVPLP
jgi:hypothetical protein